MIGITAEVTIFSDEIAVEVIDMSGNQDILKVAVGMNKSVAFLRQLKEMMDYMQVFKLPHLYYRLV